MKTAAPSVLLLAVLGLTAASAASPTVKPEDVGLSSERLQRISQMIQRRIAAGEIAGAVAVVARKGKVAHPSVQGVMDLESKQPVTPATMFRIASMTKPVIGVAIMMMIEEGKVRLNDPISRYIPEFRGHESRRRAGRAARPGGGAPQFYTVPAQREITVKDLLTHVSGLGSGPMGISDIAKVARKEGEKLADYIPRLGGTALEFQPGSRWAYSPRAGFETLGRIVEIASGLPLDQFFRTRIFDPLGMKDITFWPSEAQWPRVARVYTRGPEADEVAEAERHDVEERVLHGLGRPVQHGRGLHPVRGDAGQRRRVERQALLSRKSVEMMSAVHVPDTLPGRPSGEGYGLSVRVVTDHAARGTMLSDGTFGWSGAQGTHFFVDPKEELVGVLMVQTANQELHARLRGSGGAVDRRLTLSISGLKPNSTEIQRRTKSEVPC